MGLLILAIVAAALTASTALSYLGSKLCHSRPNQPLASQPPHHPVVEVSDPHPPGFNYYRPPTKRPPGRAVRFAPPPPPTPAPSAGRRREVVWTEAGPEYVRPLRSKGKERR